MTVTPEMISWGQYSKYAGAYFKGVQRYKLPENLSELDKWLAVITACESGHYDAINGYDAGIFSLGLIQWVEINQFNVSNMLGEVIEKCGPEAVMIPLKPAFELTNSTFKKNAQGKWRFSFLDSRGDVINSEKTRELFLGCSGQKDAWTPEAVKRTKLWASCIANVWESEAARKVQDEFTCSRLKWFIMPDAKAVLFDGTPDDPWPAATRAAYVSFAINLPAVANSMVKSASEVLTHKKWSPEWCTLVIKQMTFGPKVTIYPARYNAIRPMIEKLWGISLPKNAELLAKYGLEPAKEAVSVDPPVPPEAHRPPTENSKTEPEVKPQPDKKNIPVAIPVPEVRGIFGFFLWVFDAIFAGRVKK